MPLPPKDRFGRKRLSPRRAPKAVSTFLILLGETQVRLRPPLSLPGWGQTYTEPTGVLRCKSTVYGLNGHKDPRIL